ncbi:MAG: hypothetical protein JST29_07705 [Bacteroidetes bacterium]|nr:hypothetical protein [Bacteroidota bacterium]MBS1591446.1 hypothetical protein [Bacteroidota bacterium]
MKKQIFIGILLITLVIIAVVACNKSLYTDSEQISLKSPDASFVLANSVDALKTRINQSIKAIEVTEITNVKFVKISNDLYYADINVKYINGVSSNVIIAKKRLAASTDGKMVISQRNSVASESGETTYWCSEKGNCPQAFCGVQASSSGDISCKCSDCKLHVETTNN